MYTGRQVHLRPLQPAFPTGRLYKRLLRDRYWDTKTSRIV
jgi:long-chain acyl-CoA synthetase